MNGNGKEEDQLISKLVTSTLRLVKKSNELTITEDDHCLSMDLQSAIPVHNNLKNKISDAILNLCKWMNCDIQRFNGPAPPLFKEEQLFAKIQNLNENIINRLNKLLLMHSNENPMGHFNGKTFVSISNNIFNNVIHMEKPQKKFSKILVNDDNSYVPDISTKPNAILPLDADLSSLAKSLSIKYSMKINNNHPYLHEIEMLDFQINQQNLSIPDECSDLKDTLQSVPYSVISTLVQLEKLVEGLSQESVITFDLECHNIRSYQGFTCLIQISTSSRDFIIDAIELHDHIWKLNKVFTDPVILKIGHATDQDIKWLQRDFNIFVVNLFDTQIASEHIGLARSSLDFLIYHYFNFKMDKRFQIVDWRQRPLPNEHINYARMDSHCLFPLFKAMVREIHLKKNSQEIIDKMQIAFKKRCFMLYEKPIFNPNKIISKHTKSLKNQIQFNCLLELVKWREKLAKTLDENPHNIVSMTILSKFCENLDKTFEENIRQFYRPIFPDLKSYVYESKNIFDRYQKLHADYLHKNSEEYWETPNQDNQTFQIQNSSNIHVQTIEPLSCSHHLDDIKMLKPKNPHVLVSEKPSKSISSKYKKIESVIKPTFIKFEGFHLYKNIPFMKDSTFQNNLREDSLSRVHRCNRKRSKSYKISPKTKNM